MQLLEVPFHYDAMVHSLSLTGVTLLKKGKYKQRHSLPPSLVQVPRAGIKLTKHTDAMPVKKVIKKKQVTNNAVLPPKIDKPPRLYFVDKKQVQHRIKNYVLGMPGEKVLYFWTITFPPAVTDDTAHILFNKWLTRLRFEKMIRSYIWVTERQKNGTIHFHIVVNRRMCIKKANKFMRASIMHCINEGSITYDRIAAMRYNGVDIAKDRKTGRVVNFAKQNKQKSLANYLTKYVTKNNTGFTHLAWHCSRDYSNIVIAVRVTEREWATTNISTFINQNKLFENEWVIFYKWNNSPPPEFEKYIAQVNNQIISAFN